MPLNKTSTQLLDRQEPLELVLMLDSFSGGENTIGEDQELKSNEARAIQNWDSVSVGGMVRSNGFIKQIDATNQGIDSSTVLLLHLDNNVTDSEITPKTVTNNNVTFSNSVFKLGTYAGVFNGTNATLTAPDSNDWYFGTGDFTIDFWVNFTSLTGEQGFVGQFADSNNLWEFVKQASNQLTMYFSSGGVIKANVITTSAISFSTATWYHLQVSRFGTTILMFVNGVSQPVTNTVPIGTNDVGNISALLTIGEDTVNAGLLNGYLDEIRISKGIARNTSNFTPPTIPYDFSYATSAIDMLGHHYEGTSVRNYAIVGGNLARVNGSALTTTDPGAFTPGILSHSQTAGNAFWITNPTDNLKYTTIAGSITVPTDKPSTACARIYYHKSRLIAEGGSPVVFGSRAGSGAATWAASGGWSTSGDSWNITMPDITQGCIPGFPSPDQVTVFTLGQTFYLYNFPNIAYQPVNINRGCSAPYSIAYGKEGAFFVSQFPTLGVFLWDTVNFTNLTLYEGFVNDINFSNRIFGVYRGNQYYLFYSSIINGNAYPDTLKVFDARFNRWMSRPVNSAVGDNFGYPKIFIKPTNDIWAASSQKGVLYQLENGTSDAGQTTNSNYVTKDFTSDDFTVDGQAQFPLSEVRMKLLKVSITYYGSVGNFTLQWTADRGARTGAQIFDLTGVGDLINTTFIVNSSYIASPPPTKTVTRSFDNSAIGSRFSFQILQNGSGVIPEIKRIKIFALALQEN